MFKSRLFQSYWVRVGLRLLIWEAAVLIFSWLVFRSWYWLKNFSDVLFLIAAMELTAAGFGMVNRTYEVNLSPWGVPALPVQPSERERREQALAQFIEARAFASLLLASGVLTILIALGMVYIK